MPSDREPIDQGATEGHAAPRLSRAGAAVRGLAIDLTPLRRSRDFRLLSLGQLVSLTGRHPVFRPNLPIQDGDDQAFLLGVRVGPAELPVVKRPPPCARRG